MQEIVPDGDVRGADQPPPPPRPHDTATEAKSPIATTHTTTANAAITRHHQYHHSSLLFHSVQVAGAKPFSDEAHTAAAIDEKTSEVFNNIGLTGLKSELVFFPTTDNGANMVAGWAPYGRAPCAVHTVQLSVKIYLNHDDIKPTRDKEKGHVGHFMKSTGVDGPNGPAPGVFDNKCYRVMDGGMLPAPFDFKKMPGPPAFRQGRTRGHTHTHGRARKHQEDAHQDRSALKMRSIRHGGGLWWWWLCSTCGRPQP